MLQLNSCHRWLYSYQFQIPSTLQNASNKNLNDDILHTSPTLLQSVINEQTQMLALTAMQILISPKDERCLSKIQLIRFMLNVVDFIAGYKTQIAQYNMQISLLISANVFAKYSHVNGYNILRLSCKWPLLFHNTGILRPRFSTDGT